MARTQAFPFTLRDSTEHQEPGSRTEEKDHNLLTSFRLHSKTSRRYKPNPSLQSPSRTIENNNDKAKDTPKKLVKHKLQTPTQYQQQQ
jgi:hypothetical protein